MWSNHKDVQKDLNKSVRLSKTSYPDKLEEATGLILQYDKEKERDLLRKRKYNNKYNNNNNKNNEEDVGDINSNKTESIGVIVHKDKDNYDKTMEKVLALVEAGHDDAKCSEGEVMTEEEFNNMIDDEEEYNKECDAQLCDDSLLG